MAQLSRLLLNPCLCIVRILTHQRIGVDIVSATDLARNTRAILDRVVSSREVLAVERNHALIAKIVPAEPTMTAEQALAGLPPPVLTVAQAAAWLNDSRTGFDDSLPDPWA